MIALFPLFEKLTIDHHNTIHDYTKDVAPYSDFNFVSIWSYNVEDDTVISDLNGNLVVRFRDYITNEHFYSFIGTKQVTETVNALLELAHTQHVTPQLKLIPEATILSTPSLYDKFYIEEDFANHDYIVSAKQLSELQGEKHHKKAALSRQFSRLYSKHLTKLLDLSQAETQSQIKELFYSWEVAKNKARTDTQHELTALERLLENEKNFNLSSFGIYNQDKLISFMITEIIHDDYAIIHFMKTNPEFKGITEATHQAHSKHMVSKGINHINMEQDLGIEGLRNAKKQWHPAFFLKKYIISEKTK